MVARRIAICDINSPFLTAVLLFPEWPWEEDHLEQIVAASDQARHGEHPHLVLSANAVSKILCRSGLAMRLFSITSSRVQG
ncbi:MAG: hypothetical protein J4F49_10850 [Rhodobacteraceae bacterium]|nr:hypothetical protein [Paracoccaceae bacterium]